MLFQQHFPFSSFFSSLSLIVLYLPFHPTTPSTCICSSSHPRPSRQGHKKCIRSVSHVAFYSNGVRVYRFHRLLHQYWEQSNKYSAFSCLQCGCYASDSKTDPSPQNYTSISNITRVQQVFGGEGSKSQRTWWCYPKRKAILEEGQDFDKITKTKNHSQCQECIKKVNRVRFELMLTWKYIHALSKVKTLPLSLSSL